MTGTRPDPDRDPARRQPGKVDHSAESIGKGKDSLQKQALRETTLDQSGDRKAADFLSDENGSVTKVQAGTAPEGDLQDAQRGQGQELPS